MHTIETLDVRNATEEYPTQRRTDCNKCQEKGRWSLVDANVFRQANLVTAKIILVSPC